MASTLQIVDANDVVLFDLHDTTGANSGSYGSVSTYLLHDPDWGVTVYESQRSSNPITDGGTTAWRRAALTPAEIRIRIDGSSYDNMRLALGELSRLLAGGCVMKWIPNNATTTLYVDVEPTDTPLILDGRELALYLATELADSPDGISLKLLRQPYFRGAERDPRVNILTNATLLRDTAQDSRPDFWSWSSASNISNEVIGANGYQFDIATAATRQFLQVTPNSSVVAAEVWTMSGYARVTSSAMTNVEVQSMIEFQTNAGAAVNTATGTLIPLTTNWQRISVAGTASATSTKAQPGLRVDCTSATSATIQFRNVQFEKASSAGSFRVGVETPSNDPIVAPGRMVYFWADGDAPTPVRCYFAGSVHRRVTVGASSGDPAFGNYAFKQAESMTAITGDMTTATFGGNASGAGVDIARCTFSLGDATANRLYWTLSATELAAVRGRTVQIMARAYAGTSSAFISLKARWQFRAYSALANNYDNGIETSTTNTTTAWEDLPLGPMTVPEDASALTLILGIGNDGSATGNVDFVHLIPAEQMGYHQTNGDLTGSAWSLYETDPEIPRVGEVNAAHSLVEVGESVGVVPFIAQPGPNVVYVARTGTNTEGVPYTYSETLNAYDASFYYSPRYHQP